MSAKEHDERLEISSRILAGLISNPENRDIPLNNIVDSAFVLTDSLMRKHERTKNKARMALLMIRKELG